MSPEEQARKEADKAAADRARNARESRLAERDLSKLSPEAREEVKIQRIVDAAVDARFARMVMQSGPGIKVTGGNGNFTFEIDSSAISLTGSGVCNANGTSTFTFNIKV